MNFLIKFSILILVFIQLLCLSSVDSIRCFQCNSVNNSGCVKLQNYQRGLFHPILCEDYPGRQAFCRKTVIQVMEKGKTHDPRVIRSCGYVPYKNPCYRADNEGHTEQVCQCFEDGCNTATGMKSFNHLIFILIPTLTTFMLNYIIYK